MRGKKRNFVTDVRNKISAHFGTFTQGRRKFILIPLLLVLLILFGVGASVMMLMGLFGIYSIIVVFRMNSEWIRKEDSRMNKRSTRNSHL